MLAKYPRLSFAMGGSIATAAVFVAASNISIARDEQGSLMWNDRSYAQRLLRKQFAENVDRMKQKSAEVRNKKSSERTQSDIKATIDHFITPYSRISIFEEDYAMYNGKGKAILIPWKDFLEIRRNRVEVLEQENLDACVRPFKSKDDSAYDAARVQKVCTKCLPQNQLTEKMG